MKIELVVFDLDGTLVSSHETIYKATVHSLNALKIPGELPHDQFRTRIGLHFEDIFNEFGIRLPDFEEFMKIYKSVYFDFIDSSEVYSGVVEIIQMLKKSGIKISLLTTKSQDQADKILKHFKLSSDFDYIMGRRPGLGHKPSADPLLKICEDLSIDPANTLIVGDSEMDIQCGKNAGSSTCGVAYGYRSKEDLNKEFPDFVIDNINELFNIVLNDSSINSKTG